MPGLDWLIARPVAHRGLHDAAAGVIENTSSAFAAAAAANYAIECDLQISADGEAMVHHDDALGRLTDGSGRLDQITSAALKRVAFKATADQMISVGELCDLVAGRVTLVIELKSGRAGDRRLADRAAAVLSAYGGPAAVMSFDPEQIVSLRTSAPRLPRGIVARARRDISTWGGFSTAASKPGLTAGRRCGHSRDSSPIRSRICPAALRSRCVIFLGMPLLTWTVRSIADRQRAARWADQMIFEGFRP